MLRQFILEAKQIQSTNSNPRGTDSPFIIDRWVKSHIQVRDSF